MAKYAQFTFYTPDGVKLKTSTQIISAEWARTLNKVGACEIFVSPEIFDIEIYSQPDLGLLIETSVSKKEQICPDDDTFWFLRKFEEVILDKQTLYRLEFEDSLSLLSRRIVAFRADDPEGSEPRTRLNGAANLEMKRVFDENMGELAPATKKWFPNVFSSPISASAPFIQKEIYWANILSIMQSIANISNDKGTPLFFDLLINLGETIKFEFKTFVNQRGDNTQEVINTTNPKFKLLNFIVDYTNVPNTAYVGGAGKGRDRLVGFAQNSQALSGRFSLFETFQSTNVANQQTLDDEASGLINNLSGVITLEGELLGNLGDNFTFGDKVRIQHKSYLIDCIITSVQSTFIDKVYNRKIFIKSLEV